MYAIWLLFEKNDQEHVSLVFSLEPEEIPPFTVIFALDLRSIMVTATPIEAVENVE